jgi:glycine cleavage system H protein
VVKVNEELVNSPQTVNQDPYQAGWLIEVEPSEPRQLNQLLDSAAYQKTIKESSD